MTAPRPGSPMVPPAVRMHMLNELDQLCGQMVRELCQVQEAAGEVPGCTSDSELQRQTAVAAEMLRVASLLEDAVFRKAAGRLTQAAIASAHGVSQQAVSARVARLGK